MKSRTVHILSLFSYICWTSQEPLPQQTPFRDPYNAIQYSQEVIDAVNYMLEDKRRLTVEHAKDQMERCIFRAQETLSIIEELALIKLVCKSTENSAQNTSEANNLIQRTIQEGYIMLEGCSGKVSHDIHQFANDALSLTTAALSHGQKLIDSISDCAIKPGLQKFACYRKTASEQVLPVKIALLDGIETQKVGDFKGMEVERLGGKCVDEVLKKCQEQVNEILVMSIQ